MNREYFLRWRGRNWPRPAAIAAIAVTVAGVVSFGALTVQRCGATEAESLHSTANYSDQWRLRNPSATVENILGLTCGMDLLVAVGDGGLIMTSTDGQDWIRRESGTSHKLADVTFGNDMFVAVGGEGTVLTSSDGERWIQRESGVDYYIQSVATDGKSIYVGAAWDALLISSDGVTWKAQKLENDIKVRRVCYVNNLFIAMGRQILTSVNGFDWVLRDIGSWTDELVAATYGNGRILAIGFQTVGESTDGTVWNWIDAEWTNVGTDEWGVDFSGSISFGSVFVAVGSGGIATSANGRSWQYQFVETGTSLNDVAYTGEQFVAVGDNGAILMSDDGRKWTNLRSQIREQLYRVVATDDVALAVGSDGVIVTSEDGIRWTKRHQATGLELRGVAYGNDMYVAVGWWDYRPNFSQVILNSRDGKVWTFNNDLPFRWSSALTDIVFAEGRFIVSAFELSNNWQSAPGIIYSSSDGLKWERHYLGESATPYPWVKSSLRDVAYANGLFVAVGAMGRSEVSRNGFEWKCYWQRGDYWARALWEDVEKIASSDAGFVLLNGGTGTDGFTSVDGEQWTRMEISESSIILDFAYGPDHYVAVGEHGAIFVKRRGGAIWRDESIDTWASLHSVAFHKGSFVIVGSGGIILGSTVEDPKLIGLRIIGDSAVGSGSVIGFQCLAEFSTGELVDVSSAATWSIGSSSPPGTYFQGERLVAGSTLNDFSVQIVARYSDGVVTAKSMPFNVTIKAGLRAWISRSVRLDQTDAAGKVSLSAESRGTTGPVSYRWNLTGSASHGSLTSRETEATYSLRGTYPVSVTVSDGNMEVTPYTLVTIDAAPLANQPKAETAPDPKSGSIRNAFKPAFEIQFDSDWENRKTNGLIVIAHGLHSSARSTWLTNMTSALNTYFLTNPAPNIVLYDWKEDADPFNLRTKSRIALPRKWWRNVGAINWNDLLNDSLPVPDFIADCYGVRLVGPVHGIYLATWILTNIDAGRIVRTAPVHLIGHSAGGFLAGECGLTLGRIIPAQQVTMLDTPFPYRQHVEKYQAFGKVERYISSVFGVLTLDFRTPSEGKLDDVTVDCALSMLSWQGVFGDDNIGWALGTLGSTFCSKGGLVPANGQYRRAFINDQSPTLWQGLSAHQMAHQWYINTITNVAAEDGFFFSPWSGRSFSELGRWALARNERLQEGTALQEESLNVFESFGVVNSGAGVYQLRESSDAGIFATLQLPDGAESLRFQYRFDAAGDGDFVSVHWGTNSVLYIAPDTELTRNSVIQADIPIREYAGETGRLILRLVSRGDTNAVATLENIRLGINSDADNDGLTNEEERALGTDPLLADSDRDGLEDAIEVKETGTNPLTADSDEDGLTDLQEFVAGTNPLDGRAVLRVTAISINSDKSITLQWEGATNRVYRVNRSFVLPPSLYITLTNGLPAELPVTRFTAPASLEVTQFYWVEVE